jgi:hypothetical protein
VLVQAAWAASRKKDSTRRGPKKAVVAVTASILTAAYYLLRDGTAYNDLGANHFDRADQFRTSHRLVRRLRDLGYESRSRRSLHERPVSHPRLVAGFYLGLVAFRWRMRTGANESAPRRDGEGDLPASVFVFSRSTYDRSWLRPGSARRHRIRRRRRHPIRLLEFRDSRNRRRGSVGPYCSPGHSMRRPFCTS